MEATFEIMETVGPRRELALKDFIPVFVVPPFIILVCFIYGIFHYFELKRRRRRNQQKKETESEMHESHHEERNRENSDRSYHGRVAARIVGDPDDPENPMHIEVDFTNIAYRLQSEKVKKDGSHLDPSSNSVIEGEVHDCSKFEEKPDLSHEPSHPAEPSSLS